MNERVKKLLTVYAIVAAVLGAYAVVVLGFHISIPCVFRLITGLKCPGCGNTGFVISAAHFRFADALRSNYMFPAEALYVVYVIVYASAAYIKTGKPDFMIKPGWLNISALALFLAWWVLRNIFGL